MSNWISKEAIIEIGLFRKTNKCAWCKKEMDVDNHNIQLCRSCRKESLDKILKEQNKGDGQNRLKCMALMEAKDVQT